MMNDYWRLREATATTEREGATRAVRSDRGKKGEKGRESWRDTLKESFPAVKMLSGIKFLRESGAIDKISSVLSESSSLTFSPSESCSPCTLPSMTQPPTFEH